jgi:hypothetical protein
LKTKARSKPGLSLRAIIAAGQAKEDARALAERLEETSRLAKARGEEVDRAQGRMRITSRDGLATLHERGGLERPEYEAGMMYRRCYETLTAGPRSNLNRDFIGGVRGGLSESAADGFAEIRAFRAQKLAAWEALATTGRQLWVLRLVAGQGRTINSLAPGGSARRANSKALMEVLRSVAVERGLRR